MKKKSNLDAEDVLYESAITQIAERVGSFLGWLSGIIVPFVPEIVCAFSLYLFWNMFVNTAIEVIFKISVSMPLLAALGLVFVIVMLKTIKRK